MREGKADAKKKPIPKCQIPVQITPAPHIRPTRLASAFHIWALDHEAEVEAKMAEVREAWIASHPGQSTDGQAAGWRARAKSLCFHAAPMEEQTAAHEKAREVRDPETPEEM